LFVETEEQLDAVTALSGSGPAFVYLFAKEMIEAGEKQGLPKEVATQLFKQTLLGSAKMVSQSQEPLTTLMERVASKGGTTEAGLKVLEERGLKGILEKTISAATQRARELR
ncbi:MAG: pyrroline-5-carboxylate reductase, partial [Deltaproteobacteria bacterium]|nr:pyrroline-5-carboxylate reductase [Deltaproteobacteria bacterium]